MVSLFVYTNQIGTPDVSTETTFRVHSDLLRHYSSQLEELLRLSPLERSHIMWQGRRRLASVVDEHYIIMQEMKPMIVRAFVHWCYTRELDQIPEFVVYSKKIPERTSVQMAIAWYIMIWVFGEKWGVPALQNDAVDSLLFLVKRCTDKPKSIAIQHLYDETKASDHKLRNVFIDVFAEEITYEELDSMVDIMPQEFNESVLARMEQHRRAESFIRCPIAELRPETNYCYYHKHPPNTTCTSRPPFSVRRLTPRDVKRPLGEFDSARVRNER